MFQPEYYDSRSQDLEPAYHDAGQFCWGTSEAWLAERLVFGSGTVPVVLPKYLVQDVDDEEDWLTAEWKFNVMREVDRL